MDKITESLMGEFLATQGLTQLSTPDGFERFANFVVVSSEHSDSFDVEDLSSPDSEVGIDGMAALANGVLLTTADEVAGLAEQNGYVEATMLFVQAKTSGHFAEAPIGTFAFAVKDFFSEQPSLPKTDFITRYLAIKGAIYDQSPKFSRGLPRLRLFYVTTGKWQDDPVLRARIAAEERALEDLGLFSEVEITPVGAHELQQLYYRTKNPVEAQFTFAQRVTLPEIEGVAEAYLGVIPAREYVKLITDDSGQVRKSLFYDNVRDYQGDNPVNQQIAGTLKSERSERFAILNNGVTIVARELRPTGDKLFIKDYQIVNGGQTSHVIFNERDQLNDDVFVPIKVISTVDEDLTTAVITATNNQTQIRAEELNARAGFERRLESFFAAFDGPQRLYYERRSKQYDGQDVERVRIITRQQLARSVASMFIDEPHRATGYVPQLMDRLGESLFGEDHELDPYYTAAFAYYKLEFLWRNLQLDREYKPGRWQILMAARHLAVGGDEVPLTAKKTAQRAQALNEVLWDDKAALRLFRDAIAVVAGATDGGWERDDMRNQPTTHRVLEAVAATVEETV